MLAWTDGRRVRMQVARDITERRTHEEASRVQQEKIQLTSRPNHHGRWPRRWRTS